MRVTPKSEEQLQKEEDLKFAAWPAGKYRFKIGKAEDAVSKSGNPMIKLTMNIYNDNGEAKVVNDYLLESFAFKMRHACEVCGVLDQYENGDISPYDFEGKEGDLILSVDKGEAKKDGSGNFPDKNGVKDYVVDKAARGAAKAVGAVAADLDDEIPFN